MNIHFIEYWAAVRLLLDGANPYSPADLLARQQRLGWTDTAPLVMWNPPWTMAFTLPFGLVSYETGHFLWFLLNTLLIFVGAHVLERIYGRDGQKSRAWLAALVFAPTYLVLLLGQIGPLVLFGVIGFLFFIKKRAWVLSGASLVLVSIKPHLLYLLWFALLLWMWRERRWQVALGLASAGVIVALIPVIFDSAIYSQYLQLFSASGMVRPSDWATPSLGIALGRFFDISQISLRWAPALMGVIWFICYWARHAEIWDWVDQLPLVLLVSLVTTGFAWTYDQIVLLPAVIQASAWSARDEIKPRRNILIATFVALSVAVLILKLRFQNDFLYFWLAPAYLIFYLHLRQQVSARRAAKKTGDMSAI